MHRSNEHAPRDFHAQVSMRPFPYPYRAGLAICSDIDGCDRRIFLKVHRFLNDEQKGLGLPVADSFFPYAPGTGQMSYFLKDGLTPSPDAEFIRQCIKDGLIDSIHSWGDFNEARLDPHFMRMVAVRLVKELAANRLGVVVWINHGSPLNRQNLKARLKPSYDGDDPKSPFYTADICRELGIKYYWCSEIVSWPLSACRRPMPFKLGLKLIEHGALNSLKLVLGRWNRIKLPGMVLHLGQRVILRDRSTLIGFTRFNTDPAGPWTLPTRHTLRHALSKKVIEEVLRWEGYIILYTHFGFPRDQCKRLFPREDEKALRLLSEKYHDGSIWVAPTSRILNHWNVRQNLSWHVSRECEKIIINIDSLEDPATGPRLPKEEELQGLCFYTPVPENTVVRLNGGNLATVNHAPDHTAWHSIGMPLAPPPGIDLLYSMKAA